jgi:hypothetical protein
MEWPDIAKILFGAGLGLLVSLGQTWLTSVRRRKHAEKLLSVELPEIQRAVNALQGKKIIPTAELPSLCFFGGNELIALPRATASHVYRLQNALIRAEMSRKIASEAIADQNSPLFTIHSTVYSEYIDSALEAMDDIRRTL